MESSDNTMKMSENLLSTTELTIGADHKLIIQMTNPVNGSKTIGKSCQLTSNARYSSINGIMCFP